MVFFIFLCSLLPSGRYSKVYKFDILILFLFEFWSNEYIITWLLVNGHKLIQYLNLLNVRDINSSAYQLPGYPHPRLWYTQVLSRENLGESAKIWFIGIAIFVQNEKEISAGFDREGRDVGLKRDFGRFRNQKQRKCHKKIFFFF